MGIWQQRHAATIDPDRFRAHNQYLEQGAAYDVPGVARWLIENGGRRYLELFDEDGAFGAEVHEVDGYRLSRDVVDSALEIMFLERCIWVDLSGLRIVDIGAGYGRFAHRFTARHPGAIVYCTDAIEISQRVCAKYLAHRRAIRAIVVSSSHLNQIAVAPDLVVNIHSWSECTLPEVVWWLDWIADREIPRIFIVPHDGPAFGTWGGEWNAPSYKPELERRGYRIAHEWAGPPMQRKFYYLWERI